MLLLREQLGVCLALACHLQYDIIPIKDQRHF
jgi:hypothetical protein